MPRKLKPNLDDKKNWQPTIANFISLLALIVSGILALYTYKVFKIADAQSVSVKMSAKASIDASNTAKNTLEETKKYNKEYLQLQKESIKGSNEDSKARSDKISESLDMQMKSLHESQKQFELNNQALLQVSNFDTLKFRGKNPIIQFFVSNLANQPAKITKLFIAAVISSPNTDTLITKAIKDLERKKLPYLTDNLYIMKESPPS